MLILAFSSKHLFIQKYNLTQLLAWLETLTSLHFQRHFLFKVGVCIFNHFILYKIKTLSKQFHCIWIFLSPLLNAGRYLEMLHGTVRLGIWNAHKSGALEFLFSLFYTEVRIKKQTSVRMCCLLISSLCSMWTCTDFELPRPSISHVDWVLTEEARQSVCFVNAHSAVSLFYSVVLDLIAVGKIHKIQIISLSSVESPIIWSKRQKHKHQILITMHLLI